MLVILGLKGCAADFPVQSGKRGPVLGSDAARFMALPTVQGERFIPKGVE